KLVESRWIEQIMVVGEGQKFVGALIVPAFRVLAEWYGQQGKTYPGDAAVIGEPSVRALLTKEVDTYNPFFNHVEQVKRFEVLPHEWTVEGGELTPTLKMKRRVILEKYGDLISRIYTG
ncbi:MAG: long-chain fatty acid--CoA ligase, partial [Bacteroidetes bacterium]|nr:long-chain fatty acid--CoA ligase [Fibrella sp.]